MDESESYLRTFDMLVDRITDAERCLERLRQTKMERYENKPAGSPLPGSLFVGRRCCITKHYETARPGSLVAVMFDGPFNGVANPRYDVVRPVPGGVGWRLVLDPQDESVVRSVLGCDLYDGIQNRMANIPSADDDDRGLLSKDVDMGPGHQCTCEYLMDEILGILMKHADPRIVDIGPHGVLMTMGPKGLEELLQVCETVMSTVGRDPVDTYDVYTIDRSHIEPARARIKADADAYTRSKTALSKSSGSVLRSLELDEHSFFERTFEAWC